jgi:hypothetical protein
MRITQDMAKSILRAIMADYLVIRHDRSGRIILARRPTFPKDRQFSEAQKEQQQRFREAAQYARSAVDKEPIYGEIAADTTRTAYNIALSDWFHAPEIEMIDLSGWTGQPGESIRIRALDDVMVKDVTVLVVGGEDIVIEQGTAAQEEDASWWVYTTTKAASGTAKVIAVAEDLPGNITQMAAQSRPAKAA